MTERNGVPVAATAGLLFAWAAHDAEEWCTIGPWARARGLPVSDALARTAITVMGAVVGVAALDGARTGGRSAVYQTALLAYGLHGFSHLALAARFGGYAPGVATTPIAVLPFWWWASTRLAHAGVRRPAAGLLPGAAALFVGGVAGSYGVAALVRRGVQGRAT
ncbi:MULTISPECIES: HXXEE domain-containing protein [Tsukamurella]|uniref:HXXEE domain-containing protein n=2 Tax=Tsukamurella TaxID=2060 RepID=A0A5C5RZP4_9ACTN|nr:MULTISPECIES: HXXEE domain-containing protein [Tsukamurella]NMD54708.1 HXXEE domain-containing protein [Tsukamurella columbiensis]TWS28617.1 HXXEE domain-containing protein [Tsukamurella conjunctivitidis]